MIKLNSIIVCALLLCAPRVVVAEHGHGATRPATALVRLAPLLKGMGDHHFPITTKSQAAQEFFRQQGVRPAGTQRATINGMPAIVGVFEAVSGQTLLAGRVVRSVPMLLPRE